MKFFYAALTSLLFLVCQKTSIAQSPTTVTTGICPGVVADFNTNDNGFNSPSIYGGIFDSALYFNAARGYWTDYLPPVRVNAPGFPRVLNSISPPYQNPNPTNTFTVGFYYIVNNPVLDRFVVRIISVTQTPMGTVSNIEASSGVQSFADWSTPTPYIDNGPDPTPFMAGFQGNVCIRLIDPDIVNSPNTTFRVEVTYLINGPTFAVFDDLSIGPLNSPLPVNFIGLAATRNTDNTVSLRWDVTEEINVREYQVEKSSDGRLFTTTGAVMAKGKSIYAFTDAGSAKTIYYRVKSVDMDGRVKYSSIVQLKGNAANTFNDQLLIYPVPAQESVTIAHKKLERGAMISITSANGKLVRKMVPPIGTSNTIVDLSGIPAGLYFVQLEDGMGGIQSAKLVKN